MFQVCANYFFFKEVTEFDNFNDAFAYYQDCIEQAKDVYIMDSFTGEIYAYYEYTEDNGYKSTYWLSEFAKNHIA